MQIVLSTCSAEAARNIARQIVEERYAACCNLIPGIESVYWWEGKLTTDTEVLMLFKAPADAVPALSRRLAELHPYETPEILALDIVSGLDRYIAWVSHETKHREGD